MLLRLPFVGAYDWPLALRMIGAHAVPGGEVTDPSAGTHRRLLPGSTGPVGVTVRPDDDAIAVQVDGDVDVGRAGVGPGEVVDGERPACAGRVADGVLDGPLEDGADVAAVGAGADPPALVEAGPVAAGPGRLHRGVGVEACHDHDGR